MPSFLPGFLICVSLMAAAPSIPTPFETIASEADAARTRDRVPEAIRLYQQGTHLRPSWADGWWYLGSLLYDQDRFSEAGEAFQHVLANTPSNGAAHAFLGLCEYGTGKYDSALAQFRSWAGAGWAGLPAFRDVAIFHFALLLTRDGRFVESLYLISPLTVRLGDNPELVEAMGLASLRLPYLPENYPPELRERIWLAGKAAVYASQDPRDFDRADEYAARLESRYGTQPEIHYFRGTLYGFENKTAEAEREYREELKISPNHAPALVALVGIDLEKGDFKEGGQMALRAVSADPNNAEAHHLLGRVYLADGNLQASASELEKAKQLAPDIPEVRSHLAMVYMKLGRVKEAKAESAAFLALKNKEEVMATARQKLGNNQQETVH
jgi:tetratricopeptide (TPR) repeat protein